MTRTSEAAPATILSSARPARFGRAQRFALLVGDDGVLLVLLRGSRVLEQASARSPDAADAVRALLLAHPRAPVVPIIDLLEQQLREVDLPRLGRLDRGKVLKRRLQATFGDDAWSGAMTQPDQAPAAGSAQARPRYLFGGLAQEEPLAGWVRLLADLPNPVSPLRLLPVEAAYLVPALLPPGGSSARWTVLVTRQRFAGLRQVVLQDGRLVFTRLAPGFAHDLTPEQEVDAIERELLSTLSYVRRLGFTDEAGLDLILVAAPGLARQLDVARLRIRTLVALSPADAANGLGVVVPQHAPSAVATREATLDENRLGLSDTVLAAAIAVRKPQLTIDPPSLNRARASARLAPLAALLALVAVLGSAAFLWWMQGDYARVSRQQDQMRAAAVEAEQRRAELEQAPRPAIDDPATREFATALVQSIELETPRYGALIERIAGALPADLRLSQLNLGLSGDQEPLIARAYNPEIVADRRELVARLTVTPVAAPHGRERSVEARVRAFERALQAALPLYTVTLLRPPSETSGLTLSGTLEPDTAPASIPPSPPATAELEIRGPS